MHKELRLGGEVVVDDIVDQGDVNTTSSNICGDQHTNLNRCTAAAAAPMVAVSQGGYTINNLTAGAPGSDAA